MTIVLPRAKLEDTNTHASLRGQRQKRQKRFNLGLGLQKAHEFGWAAPWPQSWRPRFERFECFAESTKSFSKTSEEGLADAKSRRTLFIDRKRTKSWKDGSYVNSFSNIPLQWSCGLANFKHSVRSLFILVLWCSVFQDPCHHPLDDPRMQCIWIPRGTSVQKPEVQTVENQLISLWQLLQVDSLTHLVDWYFPMVLKQEIRLLRGFFGAWQGLRSPKTKLQDFMNFWYLSHRQNRSSPCEFYKFSPFIAYSVLSISCVPLKVLYSSIFCLCRESSFISHFPWRGNSTTFFLPLPDLLDRGVGGVIVVLGGGVVFIVRCCMGGEGGFIVGRWGVFFFWRYSTVYWRV